MFERCQSVTLPTAEALLALVPELLRASGELAPRPLREAPDGAHVLVSVMAHLSPAFSNPDFDPELGEVTGLERAFLERQIERTHRESQLDPTRPWRWVLTSLADAPLVDWRLFDGGAPYALVILEVPLLALDGRRALLRGQRQDPTYAEDFACWLTRDGAAWRTI
ncbi:MAG: hypothetical protein H6719_38490 [Sandaracinaceae bacterium]|nr:hypothetical protein [Sandaracinaceae bacterium]